MNRDSVSILLTNIRNAQATKKVQVVVPFTEIICSILRTLKREGYINTFFVCSSSKRHLKIVIVLKYMDDKPVISCITQISKPGLRVYTKHTNIKPHLNGLGITILATSKGTITDKLAKKLNVGGEVICHIS
ncbi:30S ribosomal protein S8 [Candidatus Tremblaya phenacola]|uniref:Small ribosomal subunit protein uS8 n=1 Tax=Candidatus Tremblayella phenacoccinincola TaxID=1010676 RepID=A0A2G0V6V7_9PROT|nr:30S ribosomal protein S8 [Candidatus Tremblaya phenacola]PHN16203.1 30S ribosomal protein S8 [Candidatus Tremblaya phenacola]